LAVAWVILSSVQLLIYAFSFKFSQKEIEFKFSGISPKTLMRVLNRNFSLQAVALLATAIDPIIKYTIGVCSSTSNVSVYEIARRFVVALSGVFSSAFRNTLPKISMLKTRQEYQDFLSLEASHISKLSVIYSVFGFGILAPVFLVISEKFYRTESAFIVFLILVLVESTNNIGYIYYTYIIGVKRERFLLILQASNVLFTYVFLTLGFKFFDDSIGLLGFYLSVLISSFLIFYFVSIFSGLSFPGILGKSGWKLLLPFNLLTGSNIALCMLFPNLVMKLQIAFCVICACVLWTPESRDLAGRIKARFIRPA
jgi:O-antigen/teichoic acid export membrane protein